MSAFIDGGNGLIKQGFKEMGGICWQARLLVPTNVATANGMSDNYVAQTFIHGSVQTFPCNLAFCQPLFF